MVIPQPSQPLVALPGIRHDHRPPLDVGLDEAAEAVRRKILLDLHPHPTRACSPDFHDDHHDRGSSEGIPASPSDGISTADIRLIDLDRASEWRPLRRDHGAAELVQHHPGRVVAIQSELALELERRNPGRQEELVRVGELTLGGLPHTGYATGPAPTGVRSAAIRT